MSAYIYSLPSFLQQLFLPHLVMKAQTAIITIAIARIGKMTSLLIKEFSSFSWNKASSLASAVSIFYTLIWRLALAWLDASSLNHKSSSACAASPFFLASMYFMYWSTIS